MATVTQLSDLATQINELRTSTETRFLAIDARLENLSSNMATTADISEFRETTEARFRSIDARFDSVDARFDSIDSRFGSIDSRFDSIDSRFDSVHSRLDNMVTVTEFLEMRTSIENRLNVMTNIGIGILVAMLMLVIGAVVSGLLN